MKKIIMTIISINKSQKIDCFWRVPDMDFCYETNATKVMVDFKFDALYR